MINGDYLDTPWITPDGKVLYTGNLQSGLISRLDNNGGIFGAPQTVANLGGTSVTSPVTRDDLTLYLALGEGTGLGIVVSTRASTTTTWQPPTEITSLKADAGAAAPSWISADGCRLYVTYAFGDTDAIYVATRPK
jgi:hypothetical protein